MSGRIRLAERRGLLGGGRPLSPVQEYACEITILADRQDDNRRFIESFKLALIGADPTDVAERVKTIFADWFPKTAPVAPTDADLDDTEPVTWEMPTTYDPDEASEMVTRLLEESSRGVLTPSDLGDDGGEWL